MRIVFWNLNNRDLSGLIAELAVQEQADILILAESAAFDGANLRALGRARTGLRFIPQHIARTRLYSRLPASSFRLLVENRIFTLHSVEPPTGTPWLLGAIHFYGKRELRDADQAELAARTRREIEEAETRMGHARTLIVGDFNMNPFERGMVSSEGFHAVMDRRIASREGRIVRGERRPFFFNPMWSLLGDWPCGPPATYHYPSSAPLCYFWNLFDQMLIRDALMSEFDQSSLSVVDKIGDTSLLNRNGIPSRTIASDHLPVSFSLNLR